MNPLSKVLVCGLRGCFGAVEDVDALKSKPPSLSLLQGHQTPESSMHEWTDRAHRFRVCCSDGHIRPCWLRLERQSLRPQVPYIFSPKHYDFDSVLHLHRTDDIVTVCTLNCAHAAVISHRDHPF